jgi:hypothetical protein
MNKEEIIRKRNILKKCPCCNGNIKDRTITLYTSLIKSLYTVCKWCRENDVHEFEMNKIKHLLSKNEYARFGDLVRFGGIVYKKEKASYGINMPRAVEFFAGKRQIPLYLVINQITNEVVESKMGYVQEIKPLKEWLKTENKIYQANYNPYTLVR